MADGNEDTTRRRYLAAVSAGALSGLAGCGVFGGDDGTPTATTTTSPEPTSTRPAETPMGTEPPTESETPPETETTAEPETSEGSAEFDPNATWAEGGPADRDGWQVTFQDDISSGELDWNTWEVGYGPFNDHNCAGAACARRENVSVEDGRLVLETTDEGADEIPNSTWLADYTTGAVCTASSFQQTFGYFEVKSKIPNQPGALPAFWAWADHGNPPEIDFYESFGDTPTRLTTTMHGDCDGDGDTDEADEGNGARFHIDRPIDENFIVYGCAWGPESVTWYVDGGQVHRVEEGWLEDCHDPHPLFPILNTHVGGREGDFVEEEHVGDPTEAEYPYHHEFEWVRVWQHEDWA